MLLCILYCFHKTTVFFISQYTQCIVRKDCHRVQVQSRVLKLGTTFRLQVLLLSGKDIDNRRFCVCYRRSSLVWWSCAPVTAPCPRRSRSAPWSGCCLSTPSRFPRCSSSSPRWRSSPFCTCWSDSNYAGPGCWRGRRWATPPNDRTQKTRTEWYACSVSNRYQFVLYYESLCTVLIVAIRSPLSVILKIVSLCEILFRVKQVPTVI